MIALPALMRDIRICSELANQLKYSVSKRVLMEMAIIRMMQPAMEQDTESLEVRINELEEKLSSGSFLMSPAETAMAQETVRGEESAVTIELSPAEYEDYQELSAGWHKLSRMQGGMYNSYLRGTKVSYEKGRGLCILFTNSFNYAIMMQGSHLEELGQSLSSQCGKTITVCARLLEEGEAAPRILRGNRIDGINMEIGMEE